MLTITDVVRYKNDYQGNKIIGFPVLLNSEVEFVGEHNILFCEDDVKLENSKIRFLGSNSVVYVGKKDNSFSLDVIVYNNSIFRIGRNTYINNKITIITSEEKHIFLGDNCLISFGVRIRVADAHLIYDAKTFNRLNPSKSVYIGDHVWIGHSVILLKGTQVGSGSVIGANSVIAGKRIQSNSCWVGNPAKQIKKEIFWVSPCVHEWTSSDTEANRVFHGENTYIYNQNERSMLFDDIDSILTKAKTSEEKLDLLIQIAKNNSKNRFAIS